MSNHLDAGLLCRECGEIYKHGDDHPHDGAAPYKYNGKDVPLSAVKNLCDMYAPEPMEDLHYWVMELKLDGYRIIEDDA